MPGSLLLTLLVAIDPVRLGATLLMISRPRPLQNMLVYWIGAMTVGVTYMLGPLAEIAPADDPSTLLVRHGGHRLALPRADYQVRFVSPVARIPLQRPAW